MMEPAAPQPLDPPETEAALASAPGPLPPRRREPLRLEIAWEACNQVGGIYTVLRSKAEAMVRRWGQHYCLLGPYQARSAGIEFEEAPATGAFGRAAKLMTDAGYRCSFGRWLVPGRPRIVLLHLDDHRPGLADLKYRLYADHGIDSSGAEPLVDEVVCFGEAVRMFLSILAEDQRTPRPGRDVAETRQIVAQVHEWMAASGIPELRRSGWPGALIFTTHATVLGRYLAMNDPVFYDHLPFYDAAAEARHFNIAAQHGIERAAAHGSHVFTTVSSITDLECRHLLGRPADLLLPNGLNIERFDVKHEFQYLHERAKNRIHEFTAAHFFPSYTFDLDRTLYFFTSGRYEYRNKGMDVSLEAMARLNHRLKASGSDRTVVFFVVTRAPTRSITVDALQSVSALSDFRKIVGEVRDQIGERLFQLATRGETPDFNSLVDEYWRLRLRRAQQAWRRDALPAVVTHDMIHADTDPVLEKLRACRLFNAPDDRVKIVFHPDFISSTSPLFGLDYDQFVRGCHLGVFPSYYEPWGYTPLESIAAGVPAVTSDLSGFGAYVEHELPEHRPDGVYVNHRRGRHPDASADELAHIMFEFCQLGRRDRIAQRNQVEEYAMHFTWRTLADAYFQAHSLAVQRI